MKADFRISQRYNISNRLSANSSMKMSRAHEKIERMRLASHDDITLFGFSGGERAPAQSKSAQRNEQQDNTEDNSRSRVISHDLVANQYNNSN